MDFRWKSCVPAENLSAVLWTCRLPITHLPAGDGLRETQSMRCCHHGGIVMVPDFGPDLRGNCLSPSRVPRSRGLIGS